MTKLLADMTFDQLDKHHRDLQAEARVAELDRMPKSIQKGLYTKIMEAVEEYRKRIQRGEGTPL